MRNRISSSYKIRKSVLLDQGVSQKFPLWVVKPKLGISELWSRWSWGWGLALKGPNGVQGKALENFRFLGLTHF